MAQNFFKKIKSFGIHEILLLSAWVFYNLYFIAASCLRYTNYYTGRFDLGNMSQTVWNTVHGNFFMLTDPNGTREVSRLAFHADFILVLLAPFYFLWEDPRTLLLIQTLVLSFGGVFVYLIAKEIIKNKNISLVFAICYFLNPAVNYTNLFDFHGVVLATTFLLGAFYFIFKSQYKLVILFLILAGLCKEEVWLINALIGLYLVFVRKQKALGTVIFATSISLFYLLIWVFIPKALGGEHFALAYYSDYGGSPSEIIKNIIFRPVQTIHTLFEPERTGYLKQLFMPLGYLSFFALFYLVFAAPDLGIDLLSSNGTLHQIYYQYSSTVTPFIFISAIFAVRFIKSKLNDIPYNAFSLVFLILTIISAYNFGPLPFAKKPNDTMFRNPLPERGTIDNYITSIPANENISATNNLGSHLSHRKQLYTIPLGIDRADTLMFLDTNLNENKESQTLEQIENDPSYNLVLQDRRFYVFKKR